MSSQSDPEWSQARTPRLLVVDDNAEGLRGLSRLLELYGFEVEPVNSGIRALEVLQAGPVPDAVLTDLFLPDVDGRDIGAAASRLVPRPFTALVTGWTQAEQAEDLNVPYFDAVFLKPVNISHLVKILRDRLQGGES